MLHMSLLFSSFTYLFLVKFFIQPTICTLPNNIQNIQTDDITSLPDKLPSIIDKITETVSRFRCPKGWKRLGGSCYYFPNITSISSHANYTCNQLHSNRSNLMQIRYAVDLFYAAHVLLRNNLSTLMIDIDPSLLKGKQISEILINDQGRWERMKKKIPEERVKYQNLIKNIIDRSNSTGIRISRRSRKIQQSSKKYQLNDTTINISSIVDNDEYEYDDLSSSDERDEFEEIKNIRYMCGDIHWNVLNINNKSTAYILTTYNLSDKIVCSLSDIELHTKYHYVCEYVLDFCFANIACGKHGHCDNTLAGFKCSCSFLFGGLFCEKITQQGIQILIGLLIIIILSSPILWLISFIAKSLRSVYHKCRKALKRKKKNTKGNNDQTQPLTSPINSEHVGNNVTNQLSLTDEQKSRDSIAKKFRTPSPSSSPPKSDLIRMFWVGILSLFCLILLYSTTVFRYYNLFIIDLSENIDPKILANVTIHLLTECAYIFDYRRGNLAFAPFAFVLIVFFSFLTKRKELCLQIFGGPHGLIPPIDPFFVKGRAATAAVFGIIAFEILKIFEELIFIGGHTLNAGVLIEVLVRIGTILLAGLRYYPVLASLHLRNRYARFLICPYIVCNIIYTIFREGSCMGYLPLSRQNLPLEEAKLRIELGTWFIVYGSIKCIPHFFFLSYIAAELCVRFAYDSIYVSLIKNRNIRPIPDEQMNNFYATKHIVKLLRPNRHRVDNEHKDKQQNKANQSFLKKIFDYIYIWDDGFRFTTMVTSTYTVAIVFLYYLACTFVFLYITRTTGHIAYLKSYIESSSNIDLGTIPFKSEIIFSAISTVIIYGIQLLRGMQKFKDDKEELYKQRQLKIPPIKYFQSSLIASDSAHFSGFLIGYMAWGFIICFHLILLILIGIRIVWLQIRHVDIILAIIVPILIIYFLKKITMTTVGKFLFIQPERKKDDKHELKSRTTYGIVTQPEQKKVDKRELKSRTTYGIFIYFALFADCFVGIASCIFRLITAALINLLFMARIDYSPFGRPFDKYDDGYAAYISYLHMELNDTNPSKFAFCSACWGAIKEEPKTYYYYDECSTTVDGDDRREESEENRLQQNRINSSRRNKTNDESIRNITHDIHQSQVRRIPKTSLHPQENDSSSVTINKNNSIRRDDNKRSGEVVLSIPKIMSTSKLRNLSLTTDKDSHTNVTKALIHQKLPPELDQTDDDDGNMKQKSHSTIPKNPRSSTIRTISSTDEEEDDHDSDINAIKIIKEKQNTQEKKKKSIILEDVIDEDEAISNQKYQIKDLKAKKGSMMVKLFPENDEDSGVSKKKYNNKTKRNYQKKISNKSNISQEKDKDSGLVVKTYDAIKKIFQFKQPIFNEQKTKDESSFNKTADSTQHKKSTSLTSIDIVDRKSPKISVNTQKTKLKNTTDENHYDAVPTEDEEEEDAVQTTTINSLPSRSQKSFTNKLYFLRTTSYYETQERSPPAVLQRPNSFFTLCGQNNTDGLESHYSELRNDPIPLSIESIDSPVNSIMNSIQLLSDYSNRQQTLTEENLIESINEKERIKRRIIARTRWYLAYSLIRNPWLRQLRKKELKRLRLEWILQNIQLNQQSEAITNSVESEILRMRKNKAKKITPPKAQPLRVLPTPNIDNNSQKPAERHIPFRSEILSDTNIQRPTTFQSEFIQQKPTMEVLQQENVNSSIHYTQRTSDQYTQEENLLYIRKK